MASIALVGMLPYEDISEVSGFPAAFASRGIPWAANLTALGEVITLPVGKFTFPLLTTIGLLKKSLNLGYSCLDFTAGSTAAVCCHGKGWFVA